MVKQIQAYVYLIKHKTLGYYYWGSRSANIRLNRMPEDDFWKFYFTSSSTVSNITDEHGLDSWITEIVYRNTDIDDVYWYEQGRIKKDINDPLCLNKKYQEQTTGNTIFSTAGKPAWNKGIPNPAIQGDNNPACQPGVGKKISDALTGIPKSQEHKNNLSISHIGSLKGMTYEEIHGEDRGKELRDMRAKSSSSWERTDEYKKNSAAGQRGKRWITDGTIAKPLFPGHPMPEGFRYGRLPCSEDSKKKNRESQLNRLIE